jgi:multidrug efflux pump subunit AcrA (membrane-fusion protein)
MRERPVMINSVEAPGSRRRSARSRRPRLDIRGPIACGSIAALLFFGGGIGAASIAPIDKGVPLAGNIIVESKVQTIQHQKGGAVGRVHVVEGQEVATGQLLVSLDTQALDQQLGAMKTQAQAASRQLDLIRQEATTMADLADRKLAARSKVLNLERQVAEVEKETASLAARISIAEEELLRTEIRSPVAGQVLSLAVHGSGAIVQPGGTLLEIVPRTDRLVVEGRLPPMHIDSIKPGMAAKVWLTGLNWRDGRPLTARLAWVSPDSIEDKRTGVAYFVARIELTETRAEIGRRFTLHPGQRTEILLLTGERTLLDHVIDPLLRNINRAFRT